MSIRVFGYGLTPEVDALLDVAAAALGLDAPPARGAIGETGLPKKVGKEAKRVAGLFAHTPRPLLESWRWARHLTRETEPGDTVVVTDARGRAGVFALEQAAAPEDERRSVVVVAGSGTMLRWLSIAGTVAGLDETATSEIDWERVLYRYATDIVTVAPATQAALAAGGFSARLIGTPESPISHIPGRGRALRVWLPEAVSREAATGDALRGLANLDAVRMLDEIVVSRGDRPDALWKGVTWEHLSGLAESMTASVVRADGSREPFDAVVFGSLHQVPRDHVPEGAVVFARPWSATAAVVPSVAWADSDDLADKLMALAGDGLQFDAPPPADVPHVDDGGPRRDGTRARRVSVAVPVYRDVRHLDECLESILRQDQPVREVILIDDGSRSDDVDAALARWAGAYPHLLKVMKQENRGVCVARNRALEAMTGDAFVFVDADDVLDPRFVSECAAVLRSDTRLAAVATWTEFFGDYSAIEAKPPFDARVGRRENPIISTGVLVDMAVREAGVRFTPDLAFVFCEDWDVWSQIIATGGEMGLVPLPLVKHRVHKSSGGFRRTELAEAVGRARATRRLRESGATHRDPT